MIFNGRLLHLWDNIFSLDYQVRLGKAPFQVAHFSIDVRGNVARGVVDTVRLRFRMNAGCIRVGRLARVKYRGQNFVIDLDQVQSLLGYFRRLGSHSCHTITDETHDVIQAVLVVRTRLRPGLPGRGIGNARHIFIGQHSMNPWQSPRLARVDIANDGMGMGTGQQSPMQHIS